MQTSSSSWILSTTFSGEPTSSVRGSRKSQSSFTSGASSSPGLVKTCLPRNGSLKMNADMMPSSASRRASSIEEATYVERITAWSSPSANGLPSSSVLVCAYSLHSLP